MTLQFPYLSSGLTILALSLWCVGCSDKAPPAPRNQPPSEHDEHDGGHAPGDEHSGDHHADAAHHDSAHHDGEHSGGEHEHGGQALTEKDVELPTSVDAGVDRLEELHAQIGQQIERKQLDRVHRTAEEMALVAKRLKKLAPNVIDDDKLTEFGRLCNDVAGYYEPIDEAADAGKAAETAEIHGQMGQAIQQMKKLFP